MRLMFSPWSLMLFAAVVGVIQLIRLNGDFLADHKSYLDQWDVMLSGGMPTERTPVATALFGICAMIGPGLGGLTASLIQVLLWIATVPVMWQLVKNMGCGRYKTFAVVAAIGVVNPVLWVNLTWGITDSLSFFGMVVLCRLLQSVYAKPSCGKMVWITLLVLSMVFLRPAMVYLLPVLALFMIIKAFGKAHRGMWLSGLAGIVVAGGLLLGWCGMVYRSTGVFSPTTISVFNRWVSARGQHLVDVRFIPDDEAGIKLKKLMAENDPYMDIRMDWPAFQRCLKEADIYSAAYGPAGYGRLNDIVRQSESAHPLAFQKALVKRFMESTEYPFGLVTVGAVYVFLIVYAVWLVVYWKRRKRFPWLATLMWTLVLSHLVVAVVGAPNDWERLTLPAAAPLMCMAAAIATMFVYRGPKRLRV